MFIIIIILWRSSYTLYYKFSSGPKLGCPALLHTDSFFKEATQLQTLKRSLPVISSDCSQLYHFSYWSSIHIWLGERSLDLTNGFITFMILPIVNTLKDGFSIQIWIFKCKTVFLNLCRIQSLAPEKILSLTSF